MMWGWISTTQRTELHVVRAFQGNQNASYCHDNTFEAIVVPVRNYRGQKCILMGDNARPHSARITTEVLDDHQTQRLEWPVMFAN